MKTWQCGRCGIVTQWDDIFRPVTCRCGNYMHKPNGIVIGNGVYSIWDDGELRWSGSAMDAVEFVRAHAAAKDDLK